MIEKEFVLVSQGIEIFRTKSQEKAVNMVKEYNDEYFDYLQKCYDNYERPADNYVDLEIEYSDEKEKDKEIERLIISLQAQEELTMNEHIKVERLNKELKIYKLRHKLALKKLNSAIRHYDNDKENNAIIYTKQILEGQGIEEKCHNMLRGDKE